MSSRDHRDRDRGDRDRDRDRGDRDRDGHRSSHRERDRSRDRDRKDKDRSDRGDRDRHRDDRDRDRSDRGRDNDKERTGRRRRGFSDRPDSETNSVAPIPPPQVITNTMFPMGGIGPPPVYGGGMELERYVGGMKRNDFYDDSNSNELPDGERRRKKKSRWGGGETEKVVIPGMPTILPSSMTPEQERIYLLQLQIEEISRRLRTGDLGIPQNLDERSPSPEPIYNSEGKRLNTREYRTRKRLEDERHSLVQKMNELNPAFKPPVDYKPPQSKISEKVLIPQEEYPDINFVGLLIGPRGNTLKKIETTSQAKIIIRGKGSVKEGKVGRKDGGPMPGEDEPLHAFVTGATCESVQKAVAQIREIIRQGVEVPEHHNELRRNQLRELALLNGTLRENDGPRCTNCGANNHRSWQCPDKPNITNNVTCNICGEVGHIARDCKDRGKEGAGDGSGGHVDKAKIDEEYLHLMAELGEAPPPSSKMPIVVGGSTSASSQLGSQAKAIAAPAPAINEDSNSNSAHSSLLPTPADGTNGSSVATGQDTSQSYPTSSAWSSYPGYTSGTATATTATVADPQQDPLYMGYYTSYYTYYATQADSATAAQWAAYAAAQAVAAAAQGGTAAATSAVAATSSAQTAYATPVAAVGSYGAQPPPPPPE